MEQNKYEGLLAELRSLGSVAVAFSGGVDSTFLLAAAKEALGDRVLAVTASAAWVPEREMREAEDFCRSLGVRQIVVNCQASEIPGFTENPKDRCYICKKAIFTKILETAKAHGIENVAEGSNMDDLGDYRPGMIAIRELGVKSPLRDAELYKEEIREYSRRMKLPTWSKPSFACLASRFPYGETITTEKLAMVEKGEQLLLDLGFRQFRVRIHGDMARIELLPEDFGRIMEEETRAKVYSEFKAYGFRYAALDLLGYRTGSMNEGLKRN